jgi:hypothetical protein
MDVAALVVSALALVVSAATFIYARRDRRRDRVWKILTESPANLRTVDALDEEPSPGTRLTMLQRTASSLDAAGAKSLGDALRKVCDHPWGTQTTEEARTDRDTFKSLVTEFMN